MGEIRIKYGRPLSTEFSGQDLILDVEKGDLYYKNKKGQLKVISNYDTNPWNPENYPASSFNVLQGPILIKGKFLGGDLKELNLRVDGTISGSIDPVDGGHF